MVQNNLRCTWGQVGDPLMQKYHDFEWGKLNLKENYLYEMLVLETFQAGLNWSVVLHKRENFRQAFKNFSIQEVAQMTDQDITLLMANQGIIRNKMKIKAAINNAQVINKIEETCSFAKYLTNFFPKPIVNHPQKNSDVLTTSSLAQNLAKQLKKDGFSFMGPVPTYSFLEAIGLINDHLENCPFKYKN